MIRSRSTASFLLMWGIVHEAQTWDVRMGAGTLAAHSAHPGLNTTDGKMVPLGIKTSWQDCRDACSTDIKCRSFDFHEPQNDSWGGWCYSRVVTDFPVFQKPGRVAGYKGTPPAPTPAVPTPVPPAPTPAIPTPSPPAPTPAGVCEKDDDCSLNGICNSTSSKCMCDPQWFGDQCEYLNVLPTSPDNGLQSPNSSSW
jgi:hypothetical protein